MHNQSNDHKNNFFKFENILSAQTIWRLLMDAIDIKILKADVCLMISYNISLVCHFYKKKMPHTSFQLYNYEWGSTMKRDKCFDLVIFLKGTTQVERIYFPL